MASALKQSVGLVVAQYVSVVDGHEVWRALWVVRDEDCMHRAGTGGVTSKEDMLTWRCRRNQ